MYFQDLWVKNGDFKGKIGEGLGRYWPQRTRSYFWGFTPLCPIWWKSTKKCDRESDHTRTDRQTDVNRFYYLSHAICYSYGANNNSNNNRQMTTTTTDWQYIMTIAKLCNENCNVRTIEWQTAIISCTCWRSPVPYTGLSKPASSTIPGCTSSCSRCWLEQTENWKLVNYFKWEWEQ